MTNLDRFMDAYIPALADCVTRYPDEYAFPLDEVPLVAARMRAAFEKGSFNHDGRAIKAACKAVGIKHTRGALLLFFAAQAPFSM